MTSSHRSWIQADDHMKRISGAGCVGCRTLGPLCARWVDKRKWVQTRMPLYREWQTPDRSLLGNVSIGCSRCLPNSRHSVLPLQYSSPPSFRSVVDVSFSILYSLQVCATAPWIANEEAPAEFHDHTTSPAPPTLSGFFILDKKTPASAPNSLCGK